MSLILWGAVLLAAVWAANWGSDHVAEPLRKLRKQWGFSAAAGGSIIGIATASPEVGVNITSAVRGVSEIGLGVMLGSTVIGIPALVTVTYLATRTRQIPGDPNHDQHLENTWCASIRLPLRCKRCPTWRFWPWSPC
jgi:cation:H+ antiporter